MHFGKCGLAQSVTDMHEQFDRQTPARWKGEINYWRVESYVNSGRRGQIVDPQVCRCVTCVLFCNAAGRITKNEKIVANIEPFPTKTVCHFKNHCHGQVVI